MTACVLRPAAAGGHVPRGRHLGQLPVGPARGPLAGRPARPPLRGVRRRARRWRRGTSAAPTSRCSTASRSTRTRRRCRHPPTVRRSCSSVVTRTARACRCCSRRWRRSPRDVRLWVAGRGTRDRAAAGSGRRGPPHRVARPDHRGREAARGCGAPTSTARRRCGASRSASCCSRRWRRRPPSWPATWPATAGSPGPTRTPCSSRRATPAALAGALGCPAGRPGPGRGAGGLGRGAGAGLLHGPPGRPLRGALRAGARRGRACPLGTAALRRRIIGGHPVATCAEVQSTWASP